MTASSPVKQSPASARRLSRKARCAAILGFLLVSAAPPPSGATAEQLYRDGVAARYAGENELAVSLLRRAAIAEPANADARLQLGLALLATGNLDEAEAELRHVLQLAPDYEDAKAGLARVEERRATANPALAELQPALPSNADAAPLRAQPGMGGNSYRWHFNVDGSYSSLEGDQPDWREAGLNLRYVASERNSIGLQVDASERFGKSDVYGELRLDQRVSDTANLYVTAGGTPDADFRPEWQIGAGGSLRVRGGPHATVLTLDARQARYEAGDIQTVSPGIEQYLAAGRIWLTGRWINIFDESGEHESGWLLRGDAHAGARTRLFAGLADAPDVSEGIVTETFSVFGGVSLDLDARSTVRFSLAHEDRARGGDRVQAGIGLGFRF